MLVDRVAVGDGVLQACGGKESAPRERGVSFLGSFEDCVPIQLHEKSDGVLDSGLGSTDNFFPLFVVLPAVFQFGVAQPLFGGVEVLFRTRDELLGLPGVVALLNRVVDARISAGEIAFSALEGFKRERLGFGRDGVGVHFRFVGRLSEEEPVHVRCL